jgi:adenylate cyclase
VRVRCVHDERFASPEFCLTAKRKSGMVRDEVNVPLTRAKFEQLWTMTEGRRLAKRRYNIPHQKWTIELDVFEGALEGLVMAEVEFPDEVTAVAFQPPKWFAREVTKDSAFRNVALATSGIVPDTSFEVPAAGKVG